MNNKLSQKEHTAYLAGMFGQNIIYAVIATGLSFYWQSVIFLPAAAISIITIISKITESLFDPLVGNIIDNTNSKYGKCRPYLLFSPLPICIFGCLCFLCRQYSNINSNSENIFIIIYSLVIYIIFGTIFCFGDVSLWAFPTLISDNKDERNSLLSNAKIIANISGSLITLIIIQIAQLISNKISSFIHEKNTALQYSTAVVCCFFIVLGSILFQITGLKTKEKVKSEYKEKSSLKDSIIIMWQCKPYRKIMISGLIRSPYLLINIVQMTLFVYYFSNNGEKPYITYMIILGLPSMLMQIAANAITPKLLKKHDKIKLFKLSNIFGGIFLLLCFVLYLYAPTKLNEAKYFTVLVILMSFYSFFLGLTSAIQTILIADAADYEENQNKKRREGIFFSGQSLLIKVSTGISSVIQGIVYSITGFSGDNISKINSALYNGAQFRSDDIFSKYRFAIFLLLFLIPSISMFLSNIPYKSKKNNIKSRMCML